MLCQSEWENKQKLEEKEIIPITRKIFTKILYNEKKKPKLFSRTFFCLRIDDDNNNKINREYCYSKNFDDLIRIN